MKVLVTDEDRDVFVSRLVEAMQEAGAEVVSGKYDKADVCLHNGAVRFKSYCRKNIIRLGEPHINTSECKKGMNDALRKSVSCCDGAVYQSYFGKLAHERMVGPVTMPVSVIYNGATPDPATREREPLYVCVARKWEPRHRLTDILEAFHQCAELGHIEGATLAIVGDTAGYEKGWVDNPRMSFVGTVKHPSRYYKRATAVICVPWVGVCPNVVVEALACGARVICTDQGGAPELVRDTDALVIGDAPFRFKPMRMSRPPRLDRLALATAIKMVWPQHCGRREAVACPDVVNIAHAFIRYLRFFEGILGEERGGTVCVS